MIRQRKKSEEGFAMLESVVFMMAFVILTAYTIDLFSAVHTGILNSTAARTYLFETLQHRTNIDWIRQEDESSNDPQRKFTNVHERFHAVSDEDQAATDITGARAAGRVLTQATETQANVADFTNLQSQKNQTSIVNIKTGYGICLDAACPSN